MKEFEIGCFVSVNNTQGLYSTYSDWAELVEATKYKERIRPDDLSSFRIVAKARHLVVDRTLYLLESKEGQFIFDNVNSCFKLTPRNKEAYEKVEDAKAGDLLFVKNDEEYTECLVIGWHPHHPAIVIEAGEMIGTATLEDLHRKVIKPIEWWEDAVDYVNKEDSFGGARFEDGHLIVDGKMTRDQWCDFARILLEQGE